VSCAVSRPGLVLQHGPDGPPARLAEWMNERELPFEVHRTWEQALPDPTEYGFVVSLGSKHSANETDPEWIPREIAALRAAVSSDVPVLGVCFGGQALSVALGGGSDTLPVPEIGWIPVESVDGAVPGGPWMQHHTELMRVPPGARELARSPAGPAAFRFGSHLGLQFHPEVDAALVDVWARTGSELADVGLTPEDLAAQSALHAPGARAQAFRLFDAWLAAARVAE
jgi:GMP synthase-like glutamine amidotransferase